MNPIVSEAILEDRKIAYAVTDRDLNVVEINGAVELLHHDHPRWLDQSLLELVPELVGSEAALTDILNGDLPRFELALINRETSNRNIIYLTIVELPYRDTTGNIVGLIHLVDDVTEIGLLEQKLAQQRNELRLLGDKLTQQNVDLEATNVELAGLSEMKSIFVSVAAHELRTPITSIKGYVELLLEEDYGPLNDRQRRYLGVLRNSGDRLLHITQNLLDVTRIETGRIELVLAPTDLPALVKDVMVELSPQLNEKSQHLNLQASPNLPPGWCDQTRAVQIINNLLSNASKYTPQDGEIEIKLSLADEPGYLLMSIADNGVGISPEDQPKLFTLFYRAGNVRKTRASGTGLGLYITRSLVELHGGRIWFESVPDQGSTFYVTFSIAD